MYLFIKNTDKLFTTMFVFMGTHSPAKQIWCSFSTGDFFSVYPALAFDVAARQTFLVSRDRLSGSRS